MSFFFLPVSWTAGVAFASGSSSSIANTHGTKFSQVLTANQSISNGNGSNSNRSTEWASCLTKYIYMCNGQRTKEHGFMIVTWIVCRSHCIKWCSYGLKSAHREYLPKQIGVTPAQKHLSVHVYHRICQNTTKRGLCKVVQSIIFNKRGSVIGQSSRRLFVDCASRVRLPAASSLSASSPTPFRPFALPAPVSTVAVSTFASVSALGISRFELVSCECANVILARGG